VTLSHITVAGALRKVPVALTLLVKKFTPKIGMAKVTWPV